jgi:hypothetical protein
MNVDDQVEVPIRAQLHTKAYDCICLQSRDQVYHQVRGQVSDHVWWPVWRQVHNQVWDQLWKRNNERK